MTAVVSDSPDLRRYEATVDGMLAGFAAYHDEGTSRVFLHTEVFPEFEGKGVGSTLARGALDDVRASGRSLVALCPFVSDYVDRNPDYADLVDQGLDASLRAR